MSQKKAPAFQFYARDWLADSEVRQLRLDERGAYIDLLCVQWNEGRIPLDCDRAGLSVGIHPDTWQAWRERIWPRVVEFFPNGRNARLDGYRKEIESRRKKASEAGRKGARKRWNDNEVDRVAMATLSQPHKGPHSTASASATAGTPSSVLSEPAAADVEKSERWNDRLAPLCRQAGGETGIANWLHWCRRMIANGVSVDELEDQIGGLVVLRDNGSLKWIPKGQSMRPAALERLPNGERYQLAKAYRRNAAVA